MNGAAQHAVAPPRWPPGTLRWWTRCAEGRAAFARAVAGTRLDTPLPPGGSQLWLDLGVGDVEVFADFALHRHRLVLTTSANYAPALPGHIRFPTGMPEELDPALPGRAGRRRSTTGSADHDPDSPPRTGCSGRGGAPARGHRRGRGPWTRSSPSPTLDARSRDLAARPAPARRGGRGRWSRWSAAAGPPNSSSRCSACCARGPAFLLLDTGEPAARTKEKLALADAAFMVGGGDGHGLPLIPVQAATLGSRRAARGASASARLRRVHLRLCTGVPKGVLIEHPAWPSTW